MSVRLLDNCRGYETSLWENCCTYTTRMAVVVEPTSAPRTQPRSESLTSTYQGTEKTNKISEQRG